MRWAVAVLVVSPWILAGVRVLFGGGAATGLPPAYLLLAGVLCWPPLPVPRGQRVDGPDLVFYAGVAAAVVVARCPRWLNCD